MIDLENIDAMSSTDFIELDFADRLKIVRRKKKLTIEQLEKLSGVSRGLIDAYENRRNSPRLATLEWLCRSLEVKASTLLGF